jgi:O-acetyl-ADP-ribose deacetylase (regulator of RNase III)
MLKVVLTARDEALASAWERRCGELDFVNVHRGSILDAECDAVVSPANSFGFMDGGIDMLYTQRFGLNVQRRLQDVIFAKHHGELLVGTAEIIETGDLRIPFLIAAPTMRVPMILKESTNPYLASRAVFLLVRHAVFTHGNLVNERVADAVKCVAFPGLGTGVGRIGPETCAHQVRAAIEDTLLDRRTFPATWAHASELHQKLYSDRTRDLQFDEPH